MFSIAMRIIPLIGLILNSNSDRYQLFSELLLDFQLIPFKRYEYISKQIDEIGIELGGWIKKQRQRE